MLAFPSQFLDYLRPDDRYSLRDERVDGDWRRRQHHHSSQREDLQRQEHVRLRPDACCHSDRTGCLCSQETGAFSILALDASNHTLYAGDANDGPVSMVNTATCNALNTSGCRQTPSTMANGDAVAIDYSNHSVYVTNFNDDTVSVFNGATCNATTQSDCTQFSVAPLPAGFFPLGGNVEQTTHTLYVPLAADTDILGYTAVIDGSTCNGIDHSGCGETPHLVQVGSVPFMGVIDPTTKTVYILSENSSKISVINAATCNGRNQSGCPQRAPALAVGVNPS